MLGERFEQGVAGQNRRLASLPCLLGRQIKSLISRPVCEARATLVDLPNMGPSQANTSPRRLSPSPHSPPAIYLSTLQVGIDLLQTTGGAA
jgi:hypothetical protein